MKVNHLLTLGVTAFAGLFTMANAQELTEGKYYLRNTESGKYIAWGAQWGTKAVLTEHGTDITVKAVEGGTFELITGAKNANRGIRPTDGYCDQNGSCTITPVGDGTFTISSETGYFRYDGTDILAVNGQETDSGILWEFLSKEELTAKMADATAKAPVNATHFITAPDFLTQDSRITSGGAWNNLSIWTTANQPRFAGPTAEANSLINNSNAEIWNMDAVDVNQTLTGLPKGTYKLSAMGFYRAGSNDNAAEVFTNKTEQLHAKFYAGQVEIPLMSIFEGANKNGKVGVKTKAGFIPNTNEDAAKYFKEGLYVNSLYFTIEEDGGSIEIGVKKNSKYNEDWVVFDNFDLQYYGDASIQEVQLVSYIKAYNEAMETLLSYQNVEMSQEAKASVATAIESNTVNLEDVTEEAIIKATKNLIEAATKAKLASLVAKGIGTDFTEIINNPNFDGNINGWIDTFSGNLNHGFQDNATYGPINEFMECWAGQYSKAEEPYLLPNGKLYQIVNLPKGQYIFSADVIATQQQVGKNEQYISSLDEATGVYIYAQSDVLFKSNACNATGNDPKRYEFKFSTTGGNTEIGLLIQDTNCNWAVMDNVKLVYNGEMTIEVYYTGLEELLEKAEILQGSKMNNLVAKELHSAIVGVSENYKNVTDVDLLSKYISTLNTAVTKAEKSAQFYSDIKNFGDDIKKEFKVSEEEAMVAYQNDPEMLNFGSLYNNNNLDESKGEEYKALLVKNFGTIYSVGADIALLASDDWGEGVSKVPDWSMQDNNYLNCTEKYYNGPYTGEVVSQTITGLKNGKYKVVVDIAASYTYEEGAREWEGATGENLSFLCVNDKETTLDVVKQTAVPVGGMKSYAVECDVLNGKITIAIKNKKIGANWFVFKVSSIKYLDKNIEAALSVSAAKYGTFVAPFEVTIPENAVAYIVNDVTKRQDGTACTSVKSVKGTLPANTPVILYSEDIISETVKGEVVDNVENPVVTVGLLTGVYTSTAAPKGSYVLQKHDDVVAFYIVDSSANPIVTPNRAYLNAPSNSNTKAILFDFTETEPEPEEEVIETGITSLINGSYEGIYTPNGIKVDKLQKGMNIVKLANGKTHKIFVK